MADAPTCLTCSLFRPDSTPRIPNYPPICDGDRALMDRHLADVANLIADLSNDEEPLIDGRRHERFGIAYFEGGHRHVFSRGTFPSDPLAPLGGVAPINSRTKAPSVSGSRERPIPIPVTALDLKADARVPNPSGVGRDWPEDQIGNLSAATVLDQWVRDIRDTLWPDQHLPEATVDHLVAWLRNRLQDVCDRHPAVVEFAEEIRSLRGALRSAAGETEPQPERCDGVPCKRCDLMTLFREADDVTCVNPDCAAVLRGDEYLEWVKTLAAEQKIKRHATQNA
jgi:hypothetical protein